MAEQDKSWQIKPKQDTTTLETEKSSLCGSLKPTDEEASLRNWFWNKSFGIQQVLLAEAEREASIGGHGRLVFLAQFDEKFFPVGIGGNAVHLQHLDVIKIGLFSAFFNGLQT